MTIAQIEHAPTFTDPLPAQSTRDRMKEICRRHDGVEVLITRLRADIETPHSSWLRAGPILLADYHEQLNNQLTQAEMRKREIEDEIINVARLLVAEADNAEMETE